MNKVLSFAAGWAVLFGAAVAGVMRRRSNAAAVDGKGRSRGRGKSSKQAALDADAHVAAAQNAGGGWLDALLGRFSPAAASMLRSAVGVPLEGESVKSERDGGKRSRSERRRSEMSETTLNDEMGEEAHTAPGRSSRRGSSRRMAPSPPPTQSQFDLEEADLYDLAEPDFYGIASSSGRAPDDLPPAFGFKDAASQARRYPKMGPRSHAGVEDWNDGFEGNGYEDMGGSVGGGGGGGGESFGAGGRSGTGSKRTRRHSFGASGSSRSGILDLGDLASRDDCGAYTTTSGTKTKRSLGREQGAPADNGYFSGDGGGRGYASDGTAQSFYTARSRSGTSRSGSHMDDALFSSSYSRTGSGSRAGSSKSRSFRTAQSELQLGDQADDHDDGRRGSADSGYYGSGTGGKSGKRSKRSRSDGEGHGHGLHLTVDGRRQKDAYDAPDERRSRGQDNRDWDRPGRDLAGRGSQRIKISKSRQARTGPGSDMLASDDVEDCPLYSNRRALSQAEKTEGLRRSHGKRSARPQSPNRLDRLDGLEPHPSSEENDGDYRRGRDDSSAVRQLSRARSGRGQPENCHISSRNSLDARSWDDEPDEGLAVSDVVSPRDVQRNVRTTRSRPGTVESKGKILRPLGDDEGYGAEQERPREAYRPPKEATHKRDRADHYKDNPPSRKERANYTRRNATAPDVSEADQARRQHRPKGKSRGAPSAEVTDDASPGDDQTDNAQETQENTKGSRSAANKRGDSLRKPTDANVRLNDVVAETDAETPRGSQTRRQQPFSPQKRDLTRGNERDADSDGSPGQYGSPNRRTKTSPPRGSLRQSAPGIDDQDNDPLDSSYPALCQPKSSRPRSPAVTDRSAYTMSGTRRPAGSLPLDPRAVALAVQDVNELEPRAGQQGWLERSDAPSRSNTSTAAGGRSLDTGFAPGKSEVSNNGSAAGSGRPDQTSSQGNVAGSSGAASSASTDLAGATHGSQIPTLEELNVPAGSSSKSNKAGLTDTINAVSDGVPGAKSAGELDSLAPQDSAEGRNSNPADNGNEHVLNVRNVNETSGAEAASSSGAMSPAAADQAVGRKLPPAEENNTTANTTSRGTDNPHNTASGSRRSSSRPEGTIRQRREMEAMGTMAYLAQQGVKERYCVAFERQAADSASIAAEKEPLQETGTLPPAPVPPVPDDLSSVTETRHAKGVSPSSGPVEEVRTDPAKSSKVLGVESRPEGSATSISRSLTSPRQGGGGEFLQPETPGASRLLRIPARAGLAPEDTSGPLAATETSAKASTEQGGAVSSVQEERSCGHSESHEPSEPASDGASRSAVQTSTTAISAGDQSRETRRGPLELSRTDQQRLSADIAQPPAVSAVSSVSDNNGSNTSVEKRRAKLDETSLGKAARPTSSRNASRSESNHNSADIVPVSDPESPHGANMRDSLDLKVLDPSPGVKQRSITGVLDDSRLTSKSDTAYYTGREAVLDRPDAETAYVLNASVSSDSRDQPGSAKAREERGKQPKIACPEARQNVTAPTGRGGNPDSHVIAGPASTSSPLTGAELAAKEIASNVTPPQAEAACERPHKPSPNAQRRPELPTQPFMPSAELRKGNGESAGNEKLAGVTPAAGGPSEEEASPIFHDAQELFDPVPKESAQNTSDSQESPQGPQPSKLEKASDHEPRHPDSSYHGKPQPRRHMGEDETVRVSSSADASAGRGQSPLFHDARERVEDEREFSAPVLSPRQPDNRRSSSDTNNHGEAAMSRNGRRPRSPLTDKDKQETVLSMQDIPHHRSTREEQEEQTKLNDERKRRQEQEGRTDGGEVPDQNDSSQADAEKATTVFPVSPEIDTSLRNKRKVPAADTLAAESNEETSEIAYTVPLHETSESPVFHNGRRGNWTKNDRGEEMWIPEAKKPDRLVSRFTEDIPEEEIGFERNPEMTTPEGAEGEAGEVSPGLPSDPKPQDSSARTDQDEADEGPDMRESTEDSSDPRTGRRGRGRRRYQRAAAVLSATRDKIAEDALTRWPSLGSMRRHWVLCAILLALSFGYVITLAALSSALTALVAFNNSSGMVKRGEGDVPNALGQSIQSFSSHLSMHPASLLVAIESAIHFVAWGALIYLWYRIFHEPAAEVVEVTATEKRQHKPKPFFVKLFWELLGAVFLGWYRSVPWRRLFRAIRGIRIWTAVRLLLLSSVIALMVVAGWILSSMMAIVAGEGDPSNAIPAGLANSTQVAKGEAVLKRILADMGDSANGNVLLYSNVTWFMLMLAFLVCLARLHTPPPGPPTKEPASDKPSRMQRVLNLFKPEGILFHVILFFGVAISYLSIWLTLAARLKDALNTGHTIVLIWVGSNVLHLVCIPILFLTSFRILNDAKRAANIKPSRSSLLVVPSTQDDPPSPGSAGRMV